MTIYQQEIQREAIKLHCNTSYNEERKVLIISCDLPLLEMNEAGYLTFYDVLKNQTKTEICNKFLEKAETIREYVGYYLNGSSLKSEDVRTYRKLCEFGDTVLAAAYSEKNGFMFCTWRQNRNGTSFHYGDYSPDYEYAKESFAKRSGLIAEKKIFPINEIFDFYAALKYTKEHCDELDYHDERRIYLLMEKLCKDFPQIKDIDFSFSED